MSLASFDSLEQFLREAFGITRNENGEYRNEAGVRFEVEEDPDSGHIRIDLYHERH